MRVKHWNARDPCVLNLITICDNYYFTKLCSLVLKVVSIIITFVYEHVCVHLDVGMLWHCDGAPPHLKRAIWEQGKTCNYYYEIR